jgi:hypothetical protein
MDRGTIRAYFIIYESDKAMNVELCEKSGAVRTFVKTFKSRLETKGSKLSDFKLQ